MNRLTAKMYDEVSYLGQDAIIAHIYDNGIVIIETLQSIGEPWYNLDSDNLKGYISKLSDTYLLVSFSSIKKPLTDYQRELLGAINECKEFVETTKEENDTKKKRVKKAKT